MTVPRPRLWRKVWSVEIHRNYGDQRFALEHHRDGGSLSYRNLLVIWGPRF